MPTATSRDGTSIGYERTGSGPPVILVDGALCHRALGPARPLAARLKHRFTVYSYDRRGRGDSGDTPPYAVEREVDDLAAVLAEAGGSACLYGISSGAALGLAAANRLAGIRRLALYEAPFIVDGSHPPRPDDYPQRIQELVATGRRDQAVRTFLRTAGTPAFAVAMMRMMPVWKRLTAVAHTIPYDFQVLGDTGSGRPLPAGRWSAATMPALVMAGGKSPAYFRHGMRALAGVLPDGQYRTLPDQTHLLKPDVLAPVLAEFFAGGRPAAR